MKKILLIVSLFASSIVNSQNLGIGTTNPLSLLHVHNHTIDNNIFLTGSSPSLRLFQGDWNSSYIRARLGLSSGYGHFVTTSVPGDFIVQSVSPSGSLIFGTNETSEFMGNGIERMRITSSGRVGIATTSPSAKFHVNCLSPTGPSNIRLENLQAGSGFNLVIDQNGYVYKSGSTSTMQTAPATNELINLRAEVDQLRKELGEMKKLLEDKNSTQRVIR